MYDTKVREYFELYCKFKNKYEHTFNQYELDCFLLDMKYKLGDALEDVDTVVVPETSNVGFLNLLSQLDKNVFVIKKRTVEQIRLELDKQSMMRSERQKLYASISDMTTLKVAAIAGNQRKRFTNILFEKTKVDGRVAFLDDSVFSGFTLQAARAAIEGELVKYIVLFSK